MESRIELGFIKEAKDYVSLTDLQARAFLDRWVKESIGTVSLEQLQKIVQQKLRTNMRNRDAEARIRDILTDYQTLLK